MEKKNSKKLINARSLKYGTNAMIMVIAVVAIAVLLNIVVGVLDLKVDLTPNKLFSLSEATETILKGLDKDVEIIGLFDDAQIATDSDYKQVTDLLSLYAKNPRIKVRYIDPDKNIGIINQLDPDKTMNLKISDFVVRSTVNGNEKKKKLEYYDLFRMELNQYTFQYENTGSNAEQGFTGAIKYVTAEYTPVVYFTEGHDEFQVDSVFTNLKGALEKNNYLVKNINLMTIENIPDDCELIVMASPKKDITFNERDLLERYFLDGGNAIFLFDYLANDPSFDEMNKLFSKFNIAVNNDKVKENDERRHVPQDPYTILVDVSSNSIIPQAFNTVLSDSRSISILKNEKDYVTITPMIRTSDQAIGEMVNKSKGDDIKGPLDIAAAIEYGGGAEKAKILVAGNSSFINDAAYQMYGSYYIDNMNYILHVMGWMIDQKDDVIIPTKPYEVNAFSITQTQVKVMKFVLSVLLPLIIFGAGLAVYLRRRHL
jgi:ABC-2 type transport system permease protein